MCLLASLFLNLRFNIVSILIFSFYGSFCPQGYYLALCSIIKFNFQKDFYLLFDE